jgi:Putative zinc-finger
MDHDEALRLQAAVKYVLGELPEVERDSFEEHYFDCGECALDVRAAAAFADNARNVLGHEAREAAFDVAAPGSGRWLGWCKPIVVVPALAVLLMALAYQSLVSVPHWKAAATQGSGPRVLPMYSLISANTRGPNSQEIQARVGEPFGVYVDIPADASYRAYVLKLEDPAGHSVILRTLTYEEAQKTQVVEVNPGRRAGAYQLVVLGSSIPESDPAKGSVLATIRFIVAFGQ